jgi:hypothetical protein
VKKKEKLIPKAYGGDFDGPQAAYHHRIQDIYQRIDKILQHYWNGYGKKTLIKRSIIKKRRKLQGALKITNAGDKNKANILP